jgi:serine/threonine protein kinase
LPNPTNKLPKLEISEAVYVGEDRWSQIYKGVLPDASRSQANANEDVAIKVFAPKYFPTGADAWRIAPTSAEREYWNTKEAMAWTESWAFAKLESLQGTTLPRFHGLFEVEYEDEPSIAIVRSFVDGIPLVEYCRQLGGETDGETRWLPVVRQIFRCVHKIHQLGVCDLDIRDENVLINPTSPDTMILYDLASVRPVDVGDNSAELSEEEKLDAQRAIERDATTLLQLVGDVCGDGWESTTPGWKERSWGFVEWIREQYAKEKHAEDEWVSLWEKTIQIFKP